MHRDNEYAQLVGNVKNRINTIIFGPIGSGKTALIKLAMYEIRDLIYVDCLLYNTEYSVLKEIIPSNRFIVCRSNYELFKELQKIVKERKLVVCFDNFTRLKDIDVMKKIMSIGICVILVGSFWKEVIWKLYIGTPKASDNSSTFLNSLKKFNPFGVRT